MDDWQAGDLALCMSGKQRPGSLSTLRTGAIYVVKKTRWARNSRDGTMGVGLFFVEEVVGRYGGRWLDARYFRKIRPHTPDAEDRETIALLNGTPVPVEA